MANLNVLSLLRRFQAFLGESRPFKVWLIVLSIHRCLSRGCEACPGVSRLALARSVSMRIEVESGDLRLLEANRGVFRRIEDF